MPTRKRREQGCSGPWLARMARRDQVQWLVIYGQAKGRLDSLIVKGTTSRSIIPHFLAGWRGVSCQLRSLPLEGQIDTSTRRWYTGPAAGSSDPKDRTFLER